MADRVKGITVVIGGDVTGLDKALSSVNKQINSTQKQLRDVERLLKMDPGNTELLAQKQRLLAEQTEKTKEKMEALQKVLQETTPDDANWEKWQNTLSSLRGQMTKTSKKIEELNKQKENLDKAGDTAGAEKVQEEIVELTKKLESLKKQAADTYEELGKPISTEQYDRIQRELIETTNAYKTSEKAARSMEKRSGLGGVMDKVSSGMGKATEGVKKFAEATKPLATAIGGLITSGFALVEFTEETRQGMAQLELNATNAGVGIDTTTDAMERLNFITGETDSNVEAISNLLQAGFDDSNMATVVEQLAGAVLSFPDTLKIESLADSLQETLATGEATGQFAELLDRLGIGAENFGEGLRQATQAGKEQEYVLEVLSSTGLGELTKQYEAANQSQKAYADAQFRLNQVLADVAERIMPSLAELMERLAGMLAENSGTIEKVIDIIAYFAEFILKLLAILSQVPPEVYLIIAVIMLVVNAFSKLSDIMNTVTGGASGVAGAINPMNAQFLQLVGTILAVLSLLVILAYLFTVITKGVNGAKSAIDGLNNLKVPEPAIPDIDIPRYASGTRNAKRGWALVGEEGPEVVLMGGGERVFTANQTRRIMQGGSQTAVGGVSIGSLTINPSAAQWGQLMDLLGQWQGARQARRAF